jgi:hypothetical protein
MNTQGSAKDGPEPPDDHRMDRLRDTLRNRIETRLRAAILAKPVYHRRAANAVRPDGRTLLRNLVEHEAFLLENRERRMRSLGETGKADILNHMRTQMLREVTTELFYLVPGEKEALRRRTVVTGDGPLPLRAEAIDPNAR